MRTFMIQSVSPSDFDGFIAYLSEHLADNGTAEAGYFQPLSRSTSTFAIDRAAAFRSGLEIPVGQQGWRRAWAALGQDREIVGHIDLRGHSERHSEHRCLLGMGVHRACRRQGIGSSLIQDARLWAASTNLLEHIDLQVLSSNRAALDLYRKAGFVEVGEIREMFKIDGQYFGYTTMTVPSRGEKNAV